MMGVILSISIAVIACFIAHEGGHYAAALCFGRRLEFRFAWGKLFGIIPIPRYIWYMPDMERWKQRIIAVSGFWVEIIFALFYLAFFSSLVALVFAVAHLALYQFYAGDASDFRWL